MYRYSRIVEIDDDYLKYLWCEDLEKYNEIMTIENSI